MRGGQIRSPLKGNTLASSLRCFHGMPGGFALRRGYFSPRRTRRARSYGPFPKSFVFFVPFVVKIPASPTPRPPNRRRCDLDTVQLSASLSSANPEVPADQTGGGGCGTFLGARLPHHRHMPNQAPQDPFWRANGDDRNVECRALTPDALTPDALMNAELSMLRSCLRQGRFARKVTHGSGRQ